MISEAIEGHHLLCKGFVSFFYFTFKPFDLIPILSNVLMDNIFPCFVCYWSEKSRRYNTITRNIYLYYIVYNTINLYFSYL